MRSLAEWIPGWRLDLFSFCFPSFASCSVSRSILSFFPTCQQQENHTFFFLWSPGSQWKIVTCALLIWSTVMYDVRVIAMRRKWCRKNVFFYPSWISFIYLQMLLTETQAFPAIVFQEAFSVPFFNFFTQASFRLQNASHNNQSVISHPHPALYLFDKWL